jgi:hypothetical protein
MIHKHIVEIIAWAGGAKIQIYVSEMGEWVDICNPIWLGSSKFRVKPEPKPDLIKKCDIDSRLAVWDCDPRGDPNLKLTFDGETGQLKSAEVLK